MNTPEDTPRREPTADSAEAIVGTGITIASIGVLFLLLGLAQALREFPSSATILCVIGVILLVAGGVLAGMGKSRKRG